MPDIRTDVGPVRCLYKNNTRQKVKVDNVYLNAQATTQTEFNVSFQTQMECLLTGC